MKIGITGISGLVGSTIAKKILTETSHSVRGLNISGFIPKKLKPFDIAYTKGDIRDVECVEHFIDDLDVVIHTAAKVSFKKSDASELFNINVFGTKNLINCLEDKPTKLIHLSSVAALGRNLAETLIDESNNWDESIPHTDYAKSKFLSEMEVHRGIAEGINAMIFLPSVVLGIDEREGSSSAIWGQIKKFPTLAPSGSTGFVDVEDIANYTVLALENWVQSGRFVLNGFNCTYKELYEKVNSIRGYNRKVRTLSEQVLKLALPFTNLISRLNGKGTLGKATIKTTSRNYNYDNKGSIQQFGNHYTPCEATLMKYSTNYYSEKPNLV